MLVYQFGIARVGSGDNPGWMGFGPSGLVVSNILVAHAKKVIFLDQFLKLKPSKMFEPCMTGG
jgi:hypothetical protein